MYEWRVRAVLRGLDGVRGGVQGFASGVRVVYEWCTSGVRVYFKRVHENVLKGCSYASVIAVPDSDVEKSRVYAVGSDRKIKEIIDAQITKETDTDG
eukprot:1161258-Pyramimonas_sp.AAC.1